MKKPRSYEALYDKYVSFRRSANAVILARDRELRKVGSTTAKAAIMFAIHHFGGKASPGEIARLIVLAPHSVVGAINRMEREGLVTRKKGHSSDRRVTRVFFTKKGKALWEKVKQSQDLITRSFSRFSDEDLERFERFLDTLRQAALETTEGPAPSANHK